MGMIPVFLCTDNAYAVPTYMTLFSLLQNARGGVEIHAIILTSRDFSPENMRLLHLLTERYPSLQLQIISMGDSYSSAKTHNPRITTPTLYRLMIPRISESMGIRKCIYLDSDTIVEGDISELWQIDPEDDEICGVTDRLLSVERPDGSLDVPSIEKYINAGALLYNVSKIMEDRTNQKLEEAGEKNHYPYDDQDIINVICYGKIRHIPLRFNIHSSCLYVGRKEFEEKYGMQNIRDARRNPVIIHYNTWKKPWSCKATDMGGIWWKYVRMQNRDVLQEYIRPFLKQYPRPLDLKETLRTALVSSRLFYPARKGYHLIRGE